MPCHWALPSNAGCGFLAVDLLQPWLGLLVLPIKNATRHGGRGGDNQLMNAQEPGGGNGARRYPRDWTSLSTTNLVTQYDQLLIFAPMAYTSQFEPAGDLIMSPSSADVVSPSAKWL